MARLATVGQPVALGAVRAMLGGAVPHALLLVGPAGVGKTTLASDIAAALLCGGAAGADRPCGACRGCRLVAHGTHPDVHRLAPEGAGDQIGIGGREDRPRGVRDLVRELSLLPVEGAGRVAIIERAHRMHDDAQSALLKALEEPPPATTLVLCADDEERLLPTVRSRCAKVRLGIASTREIERFLGERSLADAPTAARLARIAGGRPGVAVAYAGAPDAVRIRGELVRTLVDLLASGASVRLPAARALMTGAGALAAALAPASAEPAPAAPSRRPRRTRVDAAEPAGRAAGVPGGANGEPPDPTDAAAQSGDAPDGEAVRVPASERRRALALLLEVWRGVARDLAAATAGAHPAVGDPAAGDEIVEIARSIEPADAAAALATLVRAGELLDANVSPELILDLALLRWPRAQVAA